MSEQDLLKSAGELDESALARLLEYIDEGRYPEDARIVLGSVAPTIVPAPVDALLGSRLEDRVIDAAASEVAHSVTPIDDVRATAAYRASILRTMTVRALRALRDGEVADRDDFFLTRRAQFDLDVSFF